MHNSQPWPTARRHPRTLQEAFGPYTSRHISTEGPKPSGYSVGWWLMITAIALASAWAVTL